MKSLLSLAALALLLSLTSACTECTEDADCKEDQFCRYDVGECEGEGVCINKDKNCVPGVVVGQPRECGCDNVTYDNACLRREAGVSKLHEGACD